MIELVVLSGKGGTGKTSTVGALAALAENKVLVDCDVDAADLHLILDYNVEEMHEFIGGSIAKIVEDKCVDCGICPDYCRFNAIKTVADESRPDGERFVIDEYACEGCGICAHFCPEQAIDFSEKVSGQWFRSETPHGPLFHARLGIAQANSGKLVAVLRREAREAAEQQGRDLIIIDGPPGIGCPVIASLTGVNYVLLVTEPSMSALHDMERLVKLLSHFKIPAGMCINRHDLNNDLTAQLERFAIDNRIALLGRIPFDRAVTDAQVAGRNSIDHGNGPAASALKAVWGRLREELQQVHQHRSGQTRRIINIQDNVEM
ncbi:MAG: ATP-binding protein [candidate division Zixibacteria bacterium]|nr:ATP-binding protein [candidate division Zixibacteria bacterium]